MTSPAADSPLSDSIHREASHWVMRRDRGLSPIEQDELSQWLAADPRHRRIFAEHNWGWEELDRITGLQASLGAMPDPDLFASRRGARSSTLRRLRWWAPLTLAAAAVLVVFIQLRRPGGGVPEGMAAPASTSGYVTSAERRVLEDGSVVELNADSEIEVRYTAAERQVRLVRGEAKFSVTRSPTRPFIVTVGNITVRAIGTVFVMALDSMTVEIVVTEGRVAVESTAVVRPSAEVLHLTAGERAIVPRAPATSAQVSTLTPTHLAARLAAFDSRLAFQDTPLADVVSVLNRHNEVKLVIGEPTLASLRISGSFRSTDVDAFVRLLSASFPEIKADRQGTQVILRRK
jgi:transmembrane sensor